MVRQGSLVSLLVYHGFDSAKELPWGKATFPKGRGETAWGVMACRAPA